MTGPQVRALMIRIDSVGWLLLIVWFVLGTGISLFQDSLVSRIGASGIWLVLVLTLFRLTLVAEQFKEKGENKYRLLGYILLFVLFVSLGSHFLLR